MKEGHQGRPREGQTDADMTGAFPYDLPESSPMIETETATPFDTQDRDV